MSRFTASFLSLALCCISLGANAAEPLRVFIRGGESNRGEQVHAHPRFLAEAKRLLAARGITVDGATDWPTPEQLAKTDVVVAYAQDGGNATPTQESAINDFVKRGGGLVVIHTAAVSRTNPQWWKGIIGGAWIEGKTKWKEGPMDLYFVENQRLEDGHPITKGASNFELDDEIYYDMDISPDVRVLATSYTPNVLQGKKPAAGGKVNIYDIQPQMWTYERTAEGGAQPYRAFVTIPGHQFATFEKPNYRAILLRGIAWAAKRPNLDEFCKPAEIAAITYPEGGPQRPEHTLSNLEVHPDFNLKLIASEPLINKPMNFDWDPSGRLWVAETPEYPNGRRGMRPDYRGREWKDHGGIDPTPGEQTRPAHDKISILTDTNGDGVMDKKDVFYEGLELVTGLVFYKDGVIVTQAPDILWLRDTNGDGKADKVEKLYTGLGTSDTHAVINNPRWGWDGWIYATHGYSAGDVTSADGSKKFGRIGSGVVRFKPDGSAFEQYSSKGGNTWGLEITNDNRVMWTQPTSGQLLMQTVLPEYALARGKVGKTNSFNVVEPSLKTFPAMSWDQLPYVQIDWVGSFTAAAGTVVYDGGAWPAEYNGDYFCTEPTINIVHHARLKPQGSSYTFFKLPGREETEFIRSKDMWWRPIEVRVAPDGNVYLADFYNQAVIHNDTRGPDHNKVNAAVRPDRDHYFGRIWKIEHKQATKLDVPDLAKAGTDELFKQLSNVNRPVRMNASRLLVEKAEASTDDVRGNLQFNLGQTARGNWTKLSSDAKVATLWTLHRMGGLKGELLEIAFADPDSAVRRNAANVAEETTSFDPKPGLVAALKDADPQVRLAALRALGSAKLTDNDAKALVTAWPKLDDDFQRSAAVGAAMQNPTAAIAAALDSGDAALTPLVGQLAQSITERNDAAAAAKLIISIAGKAGDASALKRSILETLAKSLPSRPPMTPELSKALGDLLTSSVSASALPLAAKWDTDGTLKDQIAKLASGLISTANNAAAGDDARLAAAQSLLGLRAANPDALATVVNLLGGNASATVQKGVITALGETNDPAAGQAIATAYGKLPADAQALAFDVLLKRADWALAFLDAVAAKLVDVTTLGPANTSRLRMHPDRAVSKRATDMLEQLNPTAKAKNDAIAKLLPVVEQPGDPAKGKLIFQATCAVCHKFDNFGADIGPGLTGMGSHGPSELLTAIVDPNREVDPSFAAWNIETKDGQFYAGIIASENPASVALKSLAGQQDVKVANIKSRVNTGRSLMPEGFDGLGGETLRDIIAYMQSVDGGNFRTLDLSKAFTANTNRGLYVAESNLGDTLKFAKTGTVKVDNIPFNIVAPEKAAFNVVQLKGGPRDSFAKTMPAKVEVPVGNFKGNRLHFLGGVAGWGHPYGEVGEVVMRVQVIYADGQTETIDLKNGVEFADYIRVVDVPGSKLAEGLVTDHELRWFTKPLGRTAPIEKLVLESTNTRVAPTTVAITAELADANAPLPATTSVAAAPAKPAPAAPAQNPAFTAPVPQPPASASGPRVLLVGGGSSHDFAKFFGASDKAILGPNVGWVDFTENANGVSTVLPNVDVIVWSANQPISGDTRKALMDWVNAGKPLVLLHPGLWYNWNNFPEWNRDICGGGARGHDKLGEFEVTVSNREHPLTKGLPEKFRITDELYWFETDPGGTPIDVLATATSPSKNKVFPQVFIVKHPKARIAGITLGHDGRAHDLAEFQTLLKNAVNWALGK